MNILTEDSTGFNPLKSACLLLGACLPAAFIILSTPKSGVGSAPRYAWVVTAVMIGKQFVQETAGITTSLLYSAIIIGQMMIALLQCCNFLVISRLEATDLVSGGVFQLSDRFAYKLYKTICLMFNLRGVGTSWQVSSLKGFPSFSDTHRDSNRKVNRSAFILRQLVIIAWQYLFLDILDQSSKEENPEDTERMFGPGTEFKYLDATAEQWAGRAATSLISWLAPARLSLDIVFRVVTLFLVVFGVANPDDVPPLFGSVLEAYTIRGFWSSYWHQQCRWALTTVSNFVCRDVLHLPRPSLLERYSNIMLVFLASGAFHVVLDAYTFKPPVINPTIAFFGGFAVAIVLEDGVQALCRRVTGVDTRNGKQAVPLWHKLVGYLWVSTWLIMTCPWYLYHAVRLPAEVKWLVPFSVVEYMRPEIAPVLLVGGGLTLKFVLGGKI